MSVASARYGVSLRILILLDILTDMQAKLRTARPAQLELARASMDIDLRNRILIVILWAASCGELTV